MATQGIWSIILVPGSASLIRPSGFIRISNAALGLKLQDASARTSVQMTCHASHGQDQLVSDPNSPPPIVLCSLSGGMAEQTSLNIVLAANEGHSFEAIGPNEVHLVGNYVHPSLLGSLSAADQPSLSLSTILPIKVAHPETARDQATAPLSSLSVYSTQDGSLTSISRSSSDESTATLPDVPFKRPITPLLSDGRPQSSKKAKSATANNSNEAGEPPAHSSSTQEVRKLKKKPLAIQPAAAIKTEIVLGKTKDTTAGIKEKRVVIRDKTVGTGDNEAQVGDEVGIYYQVRDRNGSVFFKQLQGKLTSIIIGKGSVVKGWDDNIAGMRAGGIRQLIVPSHLGYGAHDHGNIPAGTQLVIDFTIVTVNNKKDDSTSA